MWSALIDNIQTGSLSIGLVVVEICPLSYFYHRANCVKNQKNTILLWGDSLTPLYILSESKNCIYVYFLKSPYFFSFFSKSH